MICPACLSPLTELQVGSLKVDACQDGCGGIWFDAFELQQVDEPGEPGEPLLHIRRNPQVVVDPQRKRECPRCPGVKLHRHFFSAKRRVQVDHCPNCAGYWLDAGELAQIREEQGETQATTEARQTSLSPEMLRYLYRLENQERKRP